MSYWEILLIGVALAMDAFAVSITNGLAEPNMGVGKWLLDAVAFALFQCGMPLIGYVCGAAFSTLVARIAPFLSFALLAFIGGKMVLDYVKDRIEDRRRTAIREFPVREEKGLTLSKVLVQAVATSLDALAVGVTMLATEATVGLPAPIYLCAAIIGVTTLVISAVGVKLGKCAAGAISEHAQLAGGLILIGIGLKLLLEGIL